MVLVFLAGLMTRQLNQKYRKIVKVANSDCQKGRKQGRKLTIFVNMKAVPWILTLVLALCISYVLCQSSKKKDTGTSLSDKVQQLVDSTAKRPVCTMY